MELFDVIKEIGLDGIALEIIDDKMKIVKSNNDRNAYKIIYKNGKFIEEIIK